MLKKNSLSCLFALTFLIFSLTAGATNYYVSNAGNDYNSGTDASSPWQTINKVNSFKNFSPGDNIYFRRGDTFYGGLVISNSGRSGSPITFSAYGSGSKPIITGFTTVDSWTNLGGNIWESNNQVSLLSSCNMVVINGVNTPMGRYPNKGYLTYQTFSGNSSITSSSLGGTNWTGAEVVIKKRRYVIDRSPITRQSGSTLYYKSATEYSGQNGFGFFIQNDARTLDQQNEWYFNSVTGKIKVFSYSTPGSVLVSGIDNLVTGIYQNNVSFINLSFTGANGSGFYIASCGNIKIQDCSIDFSNNGVWGADKGVQSSNFSINNSSINHSNNIAINLSTEFSGATITNNVITNSGLNVGMAKIGDVSYQGIYTSGANTIVSYNDIDSSGYNGISFNSSAKITNNFVNNYCLVKDDGAGIYTTSALGGSAINNNIVLNAIGNGDGTPWPDTRPLAEGIYLDSYAKGIEVSNNSIANIPRNGIYLHNIKNVVVKNNTIFNTGFHALEVKNSESGNIVSGLTITNNILFTKDPSQKPVRYYSTHNDLNSFGTIDYNYYAKSTDDSFLINLLPSGDGKGEYNYTLSQWQKFSGNDMNSKTFTKAISNSNDLRFEYNVTNENKTISLDANYVDLANISYNGNITLAPYTSAILIKNGPIKQSTLLPASNPSNTTNGLDYNYYEANSYTLLPSFDALTPIKTGTTNNFDISLANRANSYSFNFAGYIDVPSDGQYTFYTTSDDGSKLFIDNVLVVDNDGLKSATENSGTIGLKAGKHAISVSYFQQGGDNVLFVSYAGPGISKQKIPNASLYRVFSNNLLPAVNPANTVNGLDYRYYEASGYSSVPTFTDLTPVKTGTANNIDISLADRSTAFSFNFTGYVDIPVDGQYTFYTTSDDGSTLYIDGVLVVNNDAIQMATEKSGVIGLKAGKHAISVGYFQQNGSKTLLVSYSGPEVNKQIIPASALYRTSQNTGLLPAVNPSNIANGLDYKYYEASSYSSVPSFNELDPVKSGAMDDFDISLANRSSAFSFNFTGYVDIPVDGQYNFYTTSDDGSNLYIDNVLVVDNDRIQNATERSGIIGLKAGKHAISVGYFQQNGYKTLLVSYSGPGVNKQPIPASALYRTSQDTELLPAVNPSNTVNGLDYKYYEASNYDSVPSFNGIDPIKSGASDKFDISLANRSTDFSFNFTGYIDVPVDGQYTFYTTSDDGSNLYIDNVLVVNNDRIQTATERSGIIGLKAGKHAISVGFFQRKGDKILSVSYSGPLIAKQTIPDKYLYRIQRSSFQRSMNNLFTPEGNNDNSSINSSINPDVSTNNPNQSLLIKADPNPFSNLIHVTIGGLSKNKFQLTLLNAMGQEVWVKNVDNISGFYSEVINTSNLTRGAYFLRFLQDNKSHVLKLIKQY